MTAQHYSLKMYGQLLFLGVLGMTFFAVCVSVLPLKVMSTFEELLPLPHLMISEPLLEDAETEHSDNISFAEQIDSIKSR